MAATSYFQSSFRFTDTGETEQHLSETYGSVVIGRGLQVFSQDLEGDADVQLHRGRYAGTWSMAVEVEQFMVCSGTGGFRWEEGRDRGDMAAEPAIFRPHAPVTSHVSQTENQVVIFDAGSLQRIARPLYGRHDLRLDFEGPRATNPAAARHWLAVLEVAQSCQRAGLLVDDLLRTTLFRLLSVNALETFRLVGDRPALHSSARRLLEVHRVAAEFFHDHASLPITLDDAAEAAGATLPELVAAFRAHEITHTSPAAYLRAVRLAAAHRDLVEGDPTLGDTVSAIGRRWGFGSSSRFAAHFRAAYGTTPKWVLDR